MATLTLPYTLIPDTLAKASEVQGNFDALKSFIAAEAVQKDASVAFTAVPAGPPLDPSTSDQFARKAYVDKRKVVARLPLTGNSSAYGDNAVTDFVLNNVTVAADRLYEVKLKSGVFVSAVSFWAVNFLVDGVLTDHVYRVEVGDDQQWAYGSTLWEPSAGTYDLSLRVNRASGSGTVTFQAASTAKRWFWVEDVGPR